MEDGDRLGAPGSMLLLARLAKQVFRRSERLLDIHIRLLLALSYLHDHDGSPQQEMAEAVCMDANNLVLLLNELEELGYATRTRDSEDRRRHRVHITEAGRDALAATAGAQDAIEQEVLQALDGDERATLWRLLTRALRGAEPATDRARDAPVETLA
jgi:DNA-binding MarR family transcriptional regulator